MMKKPTTSQEAKPRQLKEERIAFRTTPTFSERLERAVALTGRNRTEFITSAVADKVDDVLRQEHYLELSDRDMEMMLEAIENPPPPNDVMLRAAARWKNHFRTPSR
jgi:uncharacterized protein (DUF1778 family)